MDVNDELLSGSRSRQPLNPDFKAGPPNLFNPNMRNLQNISSPFNQAPSEDANLAPQAQIFCMLSEQMTRLSTQFEIICLRVEQGSINENIERLLKKADKYRRKAEDTERMVEILREKMLRNDDTIGNLVKKSEKEVLEAGNQILYCFKKDLESNARRVMDTVDNARTGDQVSNLVIKNNRDGQIDRNKDYVQSEFKPPSDNLAKSSMPVPNPAGPFPKVPTPVATQPTPSIQIKSPAGPLINVSESQYSKFKPPPFVSSSSHSNPNPEPTPIKVASDKNTSSNPPGLTPNAQLKEPPKLLNDAPQIRITNQNSYQTSDINKPEVVSAPQLIKQSTPGPFPNSYSHLPPPPTSSNPPNDPSGPIKMPSVLSAPKPTFPEPVIVSNTNVSKPPSLINQGGLPTPPSPPVLNITPPIQPVKPPNFPGGPGFPKVTSNPPSNQPPLKPPLLNPSGRPQEANSETPNAATGPSQIPPPVVQPKSPFPTFPFPTTQAPPQIPPQFQGPPQFQPLNQPQPPLLTQHPPSNQFNIPKANIVLQPAVDKPFPFTLQGPNLTQPPQANPPKLNESPQAPVLSPPIIKPPTGSINPPQFPGTQVKAPLINQNNFFNDPEKRLSQYSGPPPLQGNVPMPQAFAPVTLPYNTSNPVNNFLNNPSQNLNLGDGRSPNMNLPKDFSNITGSN